MKTRTKTLQEYTQTSMASCVVTLASDANKKKKVKERKIRDANDDTFIFVPPFLFLRKSQFE